MKSKTKYNYTYFLIPFVIKDINEFLKKIINNKNFNLHFFNKIKDLDIVNTFSSHITNNLFLNEDTKKMSLQEKISSLLSKDFSAFEYNIDEDFYGKIDPEKDYNSIYFTINKINLYIFKPNIAILSLKTIIDSNQFDDILDFNYRFKEIFSNYSNMLKFQNIKIANNSFKKLEDLKIFLNQTIGIDFNTLKIDTNSDLLYTFSYTCLENLYWNESTDSNIINNMIHKFMKVYSSSYDTDIQNLNTNIITEIEFRKIGITKTSSNLLCSGIDPYNFGYLPLKYETIYLFTYIYCIYIKIFLTNCNLRLSKKISRKEKIEINNLFLSFNKNFWFKEITLSERLTQYYDSLFITLDIPKLYSEVENKLKLEFRYEKIKTQNILLKVNIFLIISLFIIFLILTKSNFFK